MSAMRRIVITAVIASSINWGGLSDPLESGVCFAQGASNSGTNNAGDDSPKDLVFLAKVNETMGTQALTKKIEEIFKKEAVKAAGLSCDLTRIKPEEIDRDVAERLMQIVRPGLSQTTIQGDIAIELETGGEKSLWTLYLKSLQHDLEELRIMVPKKDNINETEETVFTSEDIGEAKDVGKAIRFRKTGVYIVSLPKGTEPKSYKAVVYDNTSDKTETYEGEWPQRQRQYIIRLYNFRGSLKELAAFLENEKVIGEPVTASFEDRPINLVTANFGPKEGLPGGIWTDNRYRVNFLQPKNRFPKRVWLQFPLSELEAEAALKSFLEDSGAAKEGDEISKLIRAGSPKLATSDGKPNKEGIPVYILEPTAKSQWHELPRLGTEENPYFSAEFELVDVDGWKSKSDVGSWRLYAFEFDDGTAQVVSVMHPLTRHQVRVVSEIDPGWIGGLNRLEGGSTKTPPADGGEQTGK